MSNEPVRRRWAQIFSRDARTEIEDELAFHLEQRIQDNLARGMDPEAARSAAEQRLGALEDVRQECSQLLRAERRSAARSQVMKMSMLDFRLGFRMLMKYPGLTIVGGLAMALAIGVGAIVFEVGTQVMGGRLDVAGDDRIVALRLWHQRANGVEEQAVYDYGIWREKLESVEELGAYRDVERNLITGAGQPVALRIAEISASAFRLAEARPLLGRPLFESDERMDAAPVLVIGERVWRTVFGADPSIVGRTVRLGKSQSTIVGVMAEDFAFPIRHTAWAPLRMAALQAGPREGPQINVFGRLAAGVSYEQAQAELNVLNAQLAVAHPETHEHMRAQVMPYARAAFPFSWKTVTSFAYSTRAAVVLFLLLMCANVATLVYARTSTRESEIVVRTSLGASRGRIVTQLLVEMLVLGALAALIGLSLVSFGLRTAMSLMEAEGMLLPFWIRDSLSLRTVLYAALLTLLAATIAGVLPALKVTRGLAYRLRQAGVGGTSLRFGRIWTGLIVAQVAVTVVFMTVTLDAQQDTAQARALDLGFPAEEYLSAQLEMHRELGKADAPDAPYSDDELANIRAMYQELHERLRAEPRVSAVTYALDFPGMYHTIYLVEAEGAARPPSGSGHAVQVASVGLNFFDALNTTIVAGRGFLAGDDVSGGLVVNETFARKMFGGANPIGRRIRHVCRPAECAPDRPPSPWEPIVGVVKDIAMNGDPDLFRADLGGVYRLWAPGDEGYLARIALRVRGNPQDFAARFRAVAAAVDPSMRVESIRSLDALYDATLRPRMLWSRFVLIVCAIVLLLSVAGTYSIMAFTVTRRTREIGIRAALGGDPRRILWAVFSRAALQVWLGVVAGGVAMVVMIGGVQTVREAILIVLPMVAVLAICALACVVPSRRALRIQPTLALKAED